MARFTAPRPAVVAALTLATAMTLTGCGLIGGEDSGSDSTAAPTPADGSTPSSTPESGDGGSSDADSERPRPSKKDVVSGLKKFYDRTDKTNAYDHDKYADCIADKGYDQWSSKTLHALKDGKPTNLDKKDAATFGAFAAACAPDAMASGSRPPLPSIPEMPKMPSSFPTAIPT